MPGWKTTRPFACATCGEAFERRCSIMLHCSPACRFKAIVRSLVPDANGCLLWPNSRNVQTGYGQFPVWVGGKRRMLTAHRMAYEVAFGSIQEGCDVLHKCDVPACINPAHLFHGTASDNVQDMYDKGRAGDVPARTRRAWVTRKDQSSLAISSVVSLK